jgi:RsiW-degrading membrane proteinase PrsW (M82 family)
LSVVTATFAAVLNSAAQGLFTGLGVVGFLAFFFLFVAPVEETVKLLAVRLYAYRDARFDTVLDGAVYGAMAGLGFAFIENALYIERGLMGTDAGTGLALAVAGTEITLTRALAGPGHVIYSAFAGYYLGLAKFNREHRGPIVIKGLLIAAVIHATYNSTVGLGASVFAALGLPDLVAAFAYILLYDGLFGALLLRKIDRYRRTYGQLYDGTATADTAVGDAETPPGGDGVTTTEASTATEPTEERPEPTDGGDTERT